MGTVAWKYRNKMPLNDIHQEQAPSLSCYSCCLWSLEKLRRGECGVAFSF